MTQATRSSARKRTSPGAATAPAVTKKKSAMTKTKAPAASRSNASTSSSSPRPPSSSRKTTKSPAIRRINRASKPSSSTAGDAATRTNKSKAPAAGSKATKKSFPSSPPSSSLPSSPSPSSKQRQQQQHQLSFPPARRFLVGTALSVYQNSGGPDTNWSVFEKGRAWGGVRPAILGGTPCGLSSGFWDGKFDADAELAASLGSNCMRLSLEWSRIVPRPGVVDRAAIQRYRSIFDALERRGMEPLVTLHHFVHPSWFDDACGGFESRNGGDEGLRHFVEWSRVAFEAFGERVASWCTFNEPGVFASSGYCTGFFPPGKVLHLRTAGEVLLRMLRSHTAAVRAMRRMSAEMHARKGKREKEGGTGIGGGGGSGSRGTKSDGEREVPRHSFGIVHNVMPYEAKPYSLPFLSSSSSSSNRRGGIDLAEDTASVEQGFHSGITVEAERLAAEAEKKKKNNNKNKKKRSRGDAENDNGENGESDDETPSVTAPTPIDPPPSRDPSRGWSPPWSRAAAALGHAQWGNDVVLRYLRSGVFDWDPLGGCLPPLLARAVTRVLGEHRVSRLARVVEREEDRPPLDWFGLNFYGRVVLDWKLAPTCYAGELMSDFGQGVWPAGFQAAIRRASRELKVPVIVTETGVPDGEDAIRAEWADAYLGAAEELLREEGGGDEEHEEEEEKEKEEGKRKSAAKKRADGNASLSSLSLPPPSSFRSRRHPVDLRGICYWSLVDSFEWAFGYSWFTKFGLFAWDFKEGPAGARVRRPSASAVAAWFRRLPAAAEARWRRHGVEFEAAFPPSEARTRAIEGGGGGSGGRERGGRGGRGGGVATKPKTAATTTAAARATKRTTAAAAPALARGKKRARPGAASASASAAASKQRRRR